MWGLQKAFLVYYYQRYWFIILATGISYHKNGGFKSYGMQEVTEWQNYISKIKYLYKTILLSVTLYAT